METPPRVTMRRTRPIPQTPQEYVDTSTGAQIYITAYRNTTPDASRVNGPLLDTKDFYAALYGKVQIEFKFPELQPIQRRILGYPETATIQKEQRKTRLMTLDTFMVMDTKLTNLANRCRIFWGDRQNTTSKYHSFEIPKASGGFRQINAPNEDLKNLQREILYFFQWELHMLSHNNAFAYVPRRSTVDAMQVHQDNASNWFLKLDIKDFFPSCALQFVFNQMRHIYPTCFLDQENLMMVLKTCMLNGVLPQGAPTSPFLSNIIMTPIDYAINHEVHNFEHHHYVYTRYADDILISCKQDFDVQKIIGIVRTALAPSPFQIKDEKTRYGSRAGRNWNLGLMLNKDNNLTLGYKFKERFRASIFNLYKDNEKGVQWAEHDLQVLAGMVSYYRGVCPEEVRALIEKYEQKFGVQLKQLL